MAYCLRSVAIALAVVVIPLQGQENRNQLEFLGWHMHFAEGPRSFEERDAVLVLTDDGRLRVLNQRFGRRSLAEYEAAGVYVDIPISSIYRWQTIRPGFFGGRALIRIFYEQGGVRDYVIVDQDDDRQWLIFTSELSVRSGLAPVHF